MESFIQQVYRDPQRRRLTLPFRLVRFMGWEKIKHLRLTPGPDNTIIIEPVEGVNPGINPVSKYAEQIPPTKA
jgi:hypothetical protein